MLHVGGANIESVTGRLLDLQTASEEGLISGKFHFQQDSVLYSKIRPYLMKVARPSFEGLCSADIYPLCPLIQVLDRDYLYYLLLSPGFTDFAISGSARAGMPKVNRDHLFDYRFELPSLNEQHRIVALLDEAFAGIAKARENTERNLENAREVFQRRLQDVFSVGSSGWQRLRLQEVASDFGRGRSRHRPRNDPSLFGGPYPFVQTGEVRGADHWITSYSQCYNDEGLAQSKLWPKGTVCITIAANIAETGILAFDACFPDSVIGLVPDERLANAEFLEYLLQDSRLALQRQGKGSAQDNINLGTFETQTFPIPTIQEQESVVLTLNELREATRHLESIYHRKLAALDALKQSLLHQAFHGDL